MLVPAQWGSLEIQLGWSTGGLPFALATADGALFPLLDFLMDSSETVQWALAEARFRISRLAPGRYQLLMNPRELWVPRWPQSPETRASPWVEVVPGRVTFLSFP